MSKDWQKGSGYVAEPKLVKDPWSSKDGYAQAASITPPEAHQVGFPETESPFESVNVAENSI